MRHDAEVRADVVPARLDVPPGVVTRYGAIGDGLTNDTEALRKACRVGRYLGAIDIPEGRFLCDELEVSSGVRVRGMAGTRIVKAGSGRFTHVLSCVSSEGQLWKLAQPGVMGSSRISLFGSNMPGAGTVILIRNALSTPQLVDRSQEMNEIVHVAGSILELKRPLIADYSESAEIISIPGVARGIRFEGVQIEIPSGCGGGGFYFERSYECSLSDCEVVGPQGQAGILFWSAAHCEAVGCRVSKGQDVDVPGNGYGIAVANCSHDVRIRRAVTRAVRENAISLGSRACSFIGCEDFDAYDSSFNTHADGNRGCTIEGCTSVRSRSYGIVLGFEGSLAAETRSSALRNRIFDSGLEGIYCGADAGRENVEPQIVENVIIDPGRRMPGRSGIRVVRARGARILGNEVFAGVERLKAAVSVEQCSGLNVQNNRSHGLNADLVVFKDSRSAGEFSGNRAEIGASPPQPPDDR